MTNPQKPLVVLITGTSSGFGLLIAARLSSLGYIVYATMRDLSRKDPLLKEVAQRGGVVNVLAMDVTKPQTIDSVVNQIAEQHGFLDILVNNAGYGMGGFFEDLSDENIRAQMETNFFGVQNVCRKVIPLMRKQKSGKIINISSIAGIQASPAFGAYNASKWALEGFSESLRYELRLFGIDVLLIEPGTYKTKIFHENSRRAQNFTNPQSPYFKISTYLDQKVIQFVDQCRKDPEDIAKFVEQLIKNSRPRFRNFPDKEARLLFYCKKLLPFSVYSWLVQKALFSNLKDVQT